MNTDNPELLFGRWPYRVALVTGASAGLGRAIAHELARAGTAVSLLARRTDLLEATAREIREMGGTATTIPCDVRDRVQVLAAVIDTTRRLGPVDLLVANAGVGHLVSAQRFEAPPIEEIYRVNLLGVVYAIEAVLPGMLERGAGHLVAISSLAGWRGMPQSGPYGSSKAAVDTLLESLRVELAPSGVRVTVAHPGFIRTAMTAANRFPMPFLMDADAAARRIVRAIRLGKRTYAFPWPTALLMRFVRLLPNAIYDRAMGNAISYDA